MSAGDAVPRDTYRSVREAASRLNRQLGGSGLVMLSFGNASVVDPDLGVIAIKPSGIPCEAVEPDQIVVVGLADGAPRAGSLRPSSDTPTHLVLYRAFPLAAAVIHTHSPSASSWAQARRAITCLGTTHADHFGDAIPVTRDLSFDEIGSDYTANTGRVITELFGPAGLDPTRVPAALVAGHGPFAWGATPAVALENAVALELVASMALATLQLRPEAPPLDASLLAHHHARKHGPSATYGQTTSATAGDRPTASRRSAPRRPTE